MTRVGTNIKEGDARGVVMPTPTQNIMSQDTSLAS